MFNGDGISPNKEKSPTKHFDAKQEKTKMKKVKKYQKNLRGGPRSSRDNYLFFAIITKISRVI
jgi:hypothetical protein